MTDCIHRRRLSDYIDGHLDPEVREEVRRHVESEPPCGCRQELDEMRRLIADLQGLEAGAAPEGGWDRVEAALDRPAARGGWRSAAAAAAVLAVAGVVALFMPRPAEAPANGIDAPSEEAPAELPPAPAPAESGTPAPDTATGPAAGPAVMQAVASTNLLAAAARAERRPVDLSDDLIVRYGAEIAQVDRLIGSLRGLPDAAGDERVQDQIGKLTALRKDILTELVLQAQARQAGPWR